MTFVRWHYRDGVYVRSHYRHDRSTPGDAQTTLIPATADRMSGSRRVKTKVRRTGRANPRPGMPKLHADRAREPISLTSIAGWPGVLMDDLDRVIRRV